VALDRDELAARCLVALLTRDGYDDEGAAHDAVTAADALLARLASSAPVAPAAPVDKRAVDRVALAKALREACHKEIYGFAPDAWDACTEMGRRGYLAEANAAVAFLRGGAS